MGLTTFESFVVVFGGLLVLMAVVCTIAILIGVHQGNKINKLHAKGIDIPTEPITLVSCRGEVNRLQGEAWERFIEVDGTGIPKDACPPEFWHGSHTCSWMERYVRFLRYIDLRIVLVSGRHFEKVNKYAKDLAKSSAMIMIVILTFPAVALYAVAGFSKPHIENMSIQRMLNFIF